MSDSRQRLAFLLGATALGIHIAAFARVSVILARNPQGIDANVLSRLTLPLLLDAENLVAAALALAGGLLWNIAGEKMRAIGLLLASALAIVDRMVFTAGWSQATSLCDLNSQRPLEIFRTAQYYANLHQLTALVIAVLCITVCAAWVMESLPARAISPSTTSS